MTLVVSLHFKNGFQDIVLPEIHDRSISYTIPTAITGFEKNIELVFGCYQEKWVIEKCTNCTFDGNEKEKPELTAGLLLKGTNAGIHHFNITTVNFNTEYIAYKKYMFTQNKITLGSSTDNIISFDYGNHAISGHHAEILKENETAYLEDKDSVNGTFLNGKRIKGRVSLFYGDIVSMLGLKIIYLGNILAINGSQAENLTIQMTLLEMEQVRIPDGPSYPVVFERSPRQSYQLDTSPVELDYPPNSANGKQQPLWMTIGPSLTMVIPMATGVLFTQWAYSQSGTMVSPAFLYMGIITSVTSAIIGIAWALINTRYAKKQQAEAEEARVQGYKDYIQRNGAMLKDKQDQNRQALNYKYPLNPECISWVEKQDHRIWENNSKQDDFLTVRVGTGMIAGFNPITLAKEHFSLSHDKLRDGPMELVNTYSVIPDAPVLLNLNTTKLLGVCGEQRRNIARELILQLSLRYSYDELKLAFLLDDGDEEYVKWIPHTWSEDHKIRLIAEDSSARSEVLYELQRELSERLDNKEKKIPHYIIFIADPSLLENSGIIRNIAENDCGFTLVMLSKSIEDLPNECNEVLAGNSNMIEHSYLDESLSENKEIAPDFVDLSLMEKTMRALSNYRVKESTASGAIPDLVTFLEMYGTNKVSDLDIYHRWLENRTYINIRSLIGYRAGGSPMYLDINEKVHGPHGLVAGTTGSGKSELLQTYILSLALNYHPYEVSFILIDYKGGGMAQSFADLPHTVGIITNLGGNQTNRALASINSEIKRRQKIFNVNHVKHIDEYIELFRDEKVSEPMPHLIIIADEFAELKKEQPDFVRQLVSASRIGRSLGIHLILATQKPNGVVDDEIWSNSRFKICLRVQDKQDSNDMLKRTDAAYITNVGRAYLEVGNNEIFEEFQSAWSGAAYDEALPLASESNSVRMINLLGKESIGGKVKHKKDKVKHQTQLEAVVQGINRTFQENQLKAMKPIWLPPLPEKISLQQFTSNLKKNILSSLVGAVDDPEMQRQYPLVVNLLETGHIFICGSISSGKTTFLQTMIYSLLTNNDASKLNVYIADYGSRTMNAFIEAPQVGAVLYDNEKDRIHKLLRMLTDELSARKVKFASQGIAVFREYFQRFNDCPAILFVIDNWPAFVEANPDLEDAVFLLSREGVSYGIYLAVTCITSNDMKTRIRTNFQTGIGLQLPDRFEYENVLGDKISNMASDHTAGRGMVKLDRTLEFQTALVCDSVNSEEIVKYIEDTARNLKQESKVFAEKVPSIPEDMHVSSFEAIPDVAVLRNSNRYLPLGYDTREIELTKMDLAEKLCICLSGNARTGKTNFIKYLIQYKQKQECDIYVITKNEELSYFAKDHEVKQVISDSDSLFNFMRDVIVKEFSYRNATYKAVLHRNHNMDMDEYLAQMRPIYVMIDNMTDFMSFVYDGKHDMEGFLTQCFTDGKQHGIYFFASISMADYQSCLIHAPFKSFISWKDGLHFGGLTEQQRIFDYEMPIQQRNKKLKPGSAYYNDQDKCIEIITPEADD